MEHLCFAANYAFLSEGNPKFPEFALISELEFDTGSDEWSNWDNHWSSWDSHWRKGIIDNENRTRFLSDAADMSGLGRNHLLLVILTYDS